VNLKFRKSLRGRGTFWVYL